MRLDSNYVRLHIVEALEAAPFAKIRYDDFDVIVVDLPKNKAAAINLMEREMPLHEILWIYDDHQRQNIHTVFLLWCEMLLPEHGEIFEPPLWLRALHALGNNKIYAYKTIGDEVFIFPVTFHPIGAGAERLVKHGDLIDVTDLSPATINITGGGGIDGEWMMADFVAGRWDEDERIYRARMGAEERRRQREYEQYYRHAKRSTQEMIHVHYRVLGVQPNTGWDDIKRAYRDLARQYHPDLNPHHSAKARMQQINAAYAFLLQTHENGNPLRR